MVSRMMNVMLGIESCCAPSGRIGPPGASVPGALFQARLSETFGLWPTGPVRGCRFQYPLPEFRSLELWLLSL
jgi:hypothetical protein